MTTLLPAVTDSVLRTIGHTPIVQLKRVAPAGGADVFVNLEYFNPTVDEEEARAFARRLAKEEGIFAGVSTGLNVLAACQIAGELEPGRRVATVAVDTGLKYLNGDLFTRT